MKSLFIKHENMDLVIKFTEKSNDSSDYSKLHTNLKTPYTQFSTLVIDSLTTCACFEVLNTNDYLVVTINGVTKCLNMADNYSSLNAETVSNLLNQLFSVNEVAIATFVDNTNRIVFVSNTSFTIDACSYNVSLVLGLYDQVLPITSEHTLIKDNLKHVVQCLSVGNYLSTPILYLLGSIGEKCFINDRGNRKILMRINNSYSANFPVIANNAEFSTYALSNDFSDITFELVDANFKPLKLLCPMYLCGTLTGDPKAETINTSITVTPEMLGQAPTGN